MIPLASAEKAHAGDRIARPLTEHQADTIDRVAVAFLGVHLRPETDFFGIVHIHPDGPVSVVDEVRALYAIAAITDSPLAWHRPPDVVWTVPA